MKKYEKDLDVIASRLKNVSDLLKCFLTFCESDEENKRFKSSKDFLEFSACFLEELKRQKVLVESAIFIVDYERDILRSLFDEQGN